LLHKFGNFLLHNGRYSLYVRLVNARSSRLGQEHPDTLMGMANLAATFGYQGRWEEDKEQGAQVQDTRRRVLGQEHADTLTSMANHAAI
jgi:hypothetical protein